MKSIAEAIQYAHRRSIVHRDLNPGNVLLDANGQPKVADFGLAKSLEADEGMTATGAILGTPGYMAPEQAAGKTDEVGPPADIYALGGILCFLLTARPPFRGATPIETLQQVINSDPVSPRQQNSEVDRFSAPNMSVLLQPWHILIAALCGMVNERQQQIIEFHGEERAEGTRH